MITQILSQSGIGAELARRLHRKGYLVATTARRTLESEHLVCELDPLERTLPCLPSAMWPRTNNRLLPFAPCGPAGVFWTCLWPTQAALTTIQSKKKVQLWPAPCACPQSFASPRHRVHRCQPQGRHMRHGTCGAFHEAKQACQRRADCRRHQHACPTSRRDVA